MPFKMCEKGHYYNTDQNASCPICAEEAGGTALIAPPPGTTPTPGTDKYNPDKGGTVPFTEPVPTQETQQLKTTVRVNNASAGGRTESADQKALPVVGWLVVLNGVGAGNDFRLVPGQNYVGRDRDMQICLDFGPDSDTTVSRSEHAVIAYDSIDNEFFISDRSKSSNLPRLNGKLIRSSTTLKTMDIIQVGETQLMFIPFCGEAFQWGDGKSQKE